MSHAVRLLARLSLAVALAAPGCRGRDTTPASRSDAILTARTLGLAYLQNGQLASAESAFRKVVALAPGQALGHANLGLVLLRQGRYREAETEIRRGATLDTASADIGLMLASVYELTGRDSAARAECERALRHSPDDPRALYALARLDPPRRERDLRRIVERSPANVVARLDLVDLLLARGDTAADQAVEQLELLRRQLPELPREAMPFFDRALAQARAGHAAPAAAAAARFHRLLETTPLFQASLQRLQSAGGALAGYPILTFNPSLAPPPAAARAITAAIRFSDVTAAAGLEAPPASADSAVTALAVGDWDGNGSDDLFLAGHLYSNEVGRALEATDRAGLRAGAAAVTAAFGDYDNDGWLDLFVATPRGGALFHNERDSTFRDVTASAGLRAADVAGATSALFLDLDHDGDLDLFLTTPAGNRAYRNVVDGPFQEASAAMGLAGGPGRDAAFADFDDDGHTDLVVAGDDGNVTLFHNLGQGHFENATAASGLAAAPAAGHAGAVAVGDYDNDGALDLLVAARDGTDPALYRNRGDGTFAVDARSGASLRALRALDAREVGFFDYDNDGFLDLVAVGRPANPSGAGRTVFLFRNDAAGRFRDASAILPEGRDAARRVAALDYDRDGDQDLVVMGEDGHAHLDLNEGGNANQYVQVQLVALRAGNGKNNDFGIGSTLELRAGPLYQTRVVTGRLTHFGLAQRVKADVLRVRWPNGVSQTVYYPGAEEDVLEQQVLKGSCPFLYAWDGRGFRMVTDVMWRSALGMPLGILGGGRDVTSAPPEASREYLRIPGRALQPRDGRYVLQLTEELWETGYLDQARLLVVDHPDSVDVYVDEQFVPPDRQEDAAQPRLYQVARPRLPVAATDEHGRDLLPLLRDRDDRYVAGFEPGRYQGMTATHDLVLDLGDLSGMDSVFLFLEGWIYPTDASINFALAQSGALRTVPPSVAVRDPRAPGGWRTVIPVLGFPSGKDKTVVADLTGKFPGADHRVRIRTNLEIYWDQAFVAGSAAASPVTITPLDPTAAQLHYRGFSRMYRRGGRYGPQWYDYDDVSRESPWEPIVGSFTRYGNVRALLDASDDRYVIFGPGDETTLEFDAGRAPPLRPGWTRDFLFYTDAWMKDADLNTATGGTVAPLPFHAMTRYPYGSDEAFPADAPHRRYIESFNTRRVERGGR